MSVGLGIVLAAFGSQATVTVGRFIMAGAGAVSIALFLLLQNNTKPDDYIRIQLNRIDADKYEPAFRISNQEVFGRFYKNPTNPVRSHYDAIIFRKDIDTSYVTLWLEPTRGDRPSEIRFPEEQMSNLFGQSKTISWEWVDASGAIVDPITEKEIAKVSERFEPLTSPGRTAWRPAIHVVGRALAQMPLEKASPDDLPILLKALDSEDASTRRAARTAISTMPVSVVPELMQALKDGFDIYRIKLGLVVALTELLREEKSLASSISDALTADDIDLLVKAAGDMDRTVRIYATEFLYDLGDSRSVIPAITMAGETTDENARYNLLFLTQGGVQKLPKENRAVVEENLKTLSDRSGSETGKLIDQIVGHLQ